MGVEHSITWWRTCGMENTTSSLSPIQKQWWWISTVVGSEASQLIYSRRTWRWYEGKCNRKTIQPPWYDIQEDLRPLAYPPNGLFYSTEYERRKIFISNANLCMTSYGLSNVLCSSAVSFSYTDLTKVLINHTCSVLWYNLYLSE